MKLSIGIIGLPNVGKSTLFNALLKKQVANVANYPFCTIEPNVGVIEVPDERLAQLAEVIRQGQTASDKRSGSNLPPIIPAVVEFYDIAGLVKGASTGEGLGNKFLAHIREVAVLVHAVRLFEDGDIVHVSEKIDPKDDIKTITTELIFADLATLDKQHEPRMNATKEERNVYTITQALKKDLNNGLTVRESQITDEQKADIAHLNLLTSKPVLYVFNLSESQLNNLPEIYEKIKTILNPDDPYIALCAKLENEILTLDDKEQKEYLKQYSLDEIGLNRLIKSAYGMLDLFSFLTAGEKEVRAWTIKNGTTAPVAAGVIHTDFEKNFIKADIVSYDDFVYVGGWVKARELGKVTSAGRDYIMKDGDVVEFKVGV